MIIVTGTKRSGTSMWMQILVAAGFPSIGKKFPADWEKHLKGANPAGFFESYLRSGINYHTNPHPEHGAYLHPKDTRRHVVKVFIPGLIRSDRAFIDHVVATMRPWREYEASLTRLHEMEVQKSGRSATRDGSLPPHLEWWCENYSLIRDFAIKQYPVSLCTYDALLANPHRLIGETLAWLGGGDTDAAAAVVESKHRTQRDSMSESFSPDVAAVCDELYDKVHRRQPLELAFIEKLNACDDALLPSIREEEMKLRERLKHRV